MIAPKYIRSFLRGCYISKEKDLDLLEGAKRGYTYQIEPRNLNQYRRTFRRDLHRFIGWALDGCEGARIIKTSTPGRRIQNAPYDFYVVVIPDPVCNSLEIEELLPM